MAYRDDLEALQARHASLEHALADIEGRSRELEALKGRRENIERQLAETRALLRSATGKRALPVLEDVRIASPCNARWDDMVGDERVRFCGGCEKSVFNLSAMPRAEAEHLLETKGDALCVRLYTRADGTILTADCPVGVKKKRVRKAALAAAGGGLLAAMAAMAAATVSATTGTAHVVPHVAAPEMSARMGAPEVTPEIAPEVTPPPAPVGTPTHTMGRVQAPLPKKTGRGAR